jgi:hypothetical protein
MSPTEMVMAEMQDKIKDLENKLNKIINDEISENIFEYSQYCQSLHYAYGNKIKDLEKDLTLTVKTLELIAGPVEFYCEVGERNKQTAAKEVLTQLSCNKEEME